MRWHQPSREATAVVAAAAQPPRNRCAEGSSCSSCTWRRFRFVVRLAVMRCRVRGECTWVADGSAPHARARPPVSSWRCPPSGSPTGPRGRERRRQQQLWRLPRCGRQQRRSGRRRGGSSRGWRMRREQSRGIASAASSCRYRQSLSGCSGRSRRHREACLPGARTATSFGGLSACRGGQRDRKPPRRAYRRSCSVASPRRCRRRARRRPCENQVRLYRQLARTAAWRTPQTEGTANSPISTRCGVNREHDCEQPSRSAGACP